MPSFPQHKDTADGVIRIKEASLTWNLPVLLFPTSLPTESASAASEVLSLQCLTRAAQGN